MRLTIILILFNLLTLNNSLSSELAKGLKKIDDYKIKGKKNFLSDFESLVSDTRANIVIEIPKNTNQKWEVSKIDGSLEHEFFMGTPRIINYGNYPVNYGMIPKTVLPINLGGDGDPLDAIVLGNPLPRGTVLKAKIIGLLKMTDTGEQDDKIVAVQEDSIYYKFNDVNEILENDDQLLIEISEWFESYKGNNIVSFINYSSQNEAINLIKFASKNYIRYGVRPR
tara:strand:- start:103 stop:777 length:675 start_codon:yes stop_codon:yes gene_type:complete